MYNKYITCMHMSQYDVHAKNIYPLEVSKLKECKKRTVLLSIVFFYSLLSALLFIKCKIYKVIEYTISIQFYNTKKNFISKQSRYYQYQELWIPEHKLLYNTNVHTVWVGCGTVGNSHLSSDLLIALASLYCKQKHARWEGIICKLYSVTCILCTLIKSKSEFI